MISVRTAQRLVLRHTKRLRPKSVSITDAQGLVLACSVKAKNPIPPFNNSAMDGYALKSSETPGRFRVVGLIRAGDDNDYRLKPHESFEIMTGAPIPKSADAVVPKEEVNRVGDSVIIKERVKRWVNVRKKGEEIKKGEIALRPNKVLTPATCGYLASLGKSEVLVFPKPKVSIIVTGEELIDPFENRNAESGISVYDSNTYSLTAALKEMAITAQLRERVPDEPLKIKQAVNIGLKYSDIILLTGGVSVGEYDYGKKVFEELGVKRVFWRVRQKPGMPLFFGIKDSVLVFGLPGNPAAVLVCFYEYVYPAIRKMMGFSSLFLEEKVLPLKLSIKKKYGRTQFYRGLANKDYVIPLEKQESHILSSFSKANCLIVLDWNKEYFPQGTKVKVHLLNLK